MIVLIGVRQPGGGLEQLESIGKCLEDMRDWALSQRIPRGDIKIFTDIPELIEAGDPEELALDDIYKWIDARASEPKPADQLIVYFSGHGMQSGGTPLWLLPQAPEKDWAAINIDTSAARAVWSRFQHIVFIGDCCASVADNVQFDSVRGGSILKNTPDIARTRQRPVDLLRAARPGKVSLEVVINGVKLSPYTFQLTESLRGRPSTILESETPGATEPLVLRVRRLADELRVSVNAFLRANKLTPPGPFFDTVVSTTEWIALFPSVPVPPAPPGVPIPPNQAPGPAVAHPETRIFGITGISGDAKAGDAYLESFAPARPDLGAQLTSIAAGALTGGVNWSSRIPDGYHYETQCGFLLNGGSFLSATSRPSVDWWNNTTEVKINSKTVELVALEFREGGGVMIPAIPGQIGFLQMDKGRLISLAYEPSGNAVIARASRQRQQFEAKSRQIRTLRDTLQEAVTGGDLRFTNISPKAILQVVEDMHYGGRVDFSTLLFLGYAAYATIASRKVILLLAEYLQREYEFVPFDFKVLLALSQAASPADFEPAPPFPLLTQGWSLLQATHEQVPEELADLTEHYRNTPWTQLDSNGIERCRIWLAKQLPSDKRGPNRNNPMAESDFGELDEVRPTLTMLDELNGVEAEAVVDDNEDQAFMT